MGGAELLIVTYRQLAPCVRRNRRHAVGFGSGRGDRFLQQHVTTCLHGSDGLRLVQIMRRTDVHNVEGSVSKHLFVVGVLPRCRHPVAVSQQLQPLLADIRQRDQFHPLLGAQNWRMPPFGDATTSDDPCA